MSGNARYEPGSVEWPPTCGLGSTCTTSIRSYWFTNTTKFITAEYEVTYRPLIKRLLSH